MNTLKQLSITIVVSTFLILGYNQVIPQGSSKAVTSNPKQIKKWEYLEVTMESTLFYVEVVEVLPKGKEEIYEGKRNTKMGVLNYYGDKGWELISGPTKYFQKSDKFVTLFKREIQ